VTTPVTESATVGDWRQPNLTVTAYDGTPGDVTTTATCTITAPAGVTPPTLTTATADTGHTWTATTYQVTAPGRWIETWDVEGHGADTIHTVVLVHATPTAGGQTWVPTREQVAAYIPRRTHVGAAQGWGETIGTFNQDTKPSARDVDSLIQQAAQWIELTAGPINTSNTAVAEAATTAAAMRVAGLIELTWPDNRDDLSDAKTLLAEADKLRRDVAAANVVIAGTDPVASGVLPVWSFPAAPADAPW
jgi:hypothetical protein